MSERLKRERARSLKRSNRRLLWSFVLSLLLTAAAFIAVVSLAPIPHPYPLD